jgi:hypothetical protein
MFPWPVTLEAEVQSQGCLWDLGRQSSIRRCFCPSTSLPPDSIILPVVHAYAKWPQQLMVLLNNAHNEGVRLDTECMYV